jgi:hypothetical protein
VSSIIGLEIARRLTALQKWASDRERDMVRRWPQVEFGADKWPLQTLYATKMSDISFVPTGEDFKNSDSAYMLAARCIAAEAALAGATKSVEGQLAGWRLLHQLDVPLAEITAKHLNDLEASLYSACKPTLARQLSQKFEALSSQLEQLGQKGVIDRLLWSVSQQTRAGLRKLRTGRQNAVKAAKASNLDSKIEALSDATACMLKNDSRLKADDRAALAAVNILMCAPSRINEPLCLGVEDRYTLEDYVSRAEHKAKDELHRVHQLLLIKGSKGADWSPKPILNFMIELAGRCWQVLMDLGKRSRELVLWYEANPDKLYLPVGLEHLRGKQIFKSELWQIVNLTTAAPPTNGVGTQKQWQELIALKVVKAVDNPRLLRSDGQRNGIKTIQVVEWSDLEALMLSRVRDRMAAMRNVAKGTKYNGKLSNMLMLFDSEHSPYLPDTVRYMWLRKRLKHTAHEQKVESTPTLFKKLNIEMVEDHHVITAYIETHDPRRWLTTQALQARERLSDVLINKWANRIKLSTLDDYDLRSAELKADQAAMPDLQELADISSGLAELEALETQYGLTTEIVVANGASVAVTSVQHVYEATEGRAVARTSNQIIILYPTRFGICLHQHHETPCRSYKKCVGCDNQIAVKGHAPSNHEWRKENELAHQSIVNQLQALITARNRQIADDQDLLDAHLLALVGEGLDAETMASELIRRFHEVKDQIRDASLKSKLHDAFVANGMVEKLNDPDVASGAVIKYHNPARHASPGLERAIDARFGGRSAMAAESEEFYRDHTEFAPTELGLHDERHLLEDVGDNDDEEAA